MGTYPRPHFFISRPDRTITPLIAVDELPNYVRIDGVKAIMTQADTQAMMSLGVKERAVGHYEVHLVKSADSTSCGEQATSTPSEVNSTSNKSFAAPGYHAADTYDDVVEVEATDSLKLPAVEIATHSEPEMTKSDERADLEVQEAADVEKWRQDVGTVDATSNTQVDPKLELLPTKANISRLALMLSSLPVKKPRERLMKRRWNKILDESVQRPDWFRERKSTVRIGSERVNVTLSNKDACTSTRCRMALLLRPSDTMLYRLGTSSHIQRRHETEDIAYPVELSIGSGEADLTRPWPLHRGPFELHLNHIIRRSTRPSAWISAAGPMLRSLRHRVIHGLPRRVPSIRTLNLILPRPVSKNSRSSSTSSGRPPIIRVTRESYRSRDAHSDRPDTTPLHFNHHISSHLQSPIRILLKRSLLLLCGSLVRPN